MKKERRKEREKARKTERKKERKKERTKEREKEKYKMGDTERCQEKTRGGQLCEYTGNSFSLSFPSLLPLFSHLQTLALLPPELLGARTVLYGVGEDTVLILGTPDIIRT